MECKRPGDCLKFNEALSYNISCQGPNNFICGIEKRELRKQVQKECIETWQN